jgi:hypothetical protein
LQAIDLNIDETYDYLRSELPDYVTFEHWIIEKKNGQLPVAPIKRFNDIVRYRRHIRPHKIVETYADIGFDIDVETYTSALRLNTLQDWHLSHASDFNTNDGDIPAHMPPLISSLDIGPLNIMQLARTWHKVLLEAKGLLHGDYPACGNGLDQGVLDALGLNREKTLAYLREKQPTYIDFEYWISEQVGEISRAKVDAFQNFLLHREHAEAKRMDIHQLTECDPFIKNAILLNHLEDWRYAYDIAIAIAIAPHR